MNIPLKEIDEKITAAKKQLRNLYNSSGIDVEELINRFESYSVNVFKFGMECARAFPPDETITITQEKENSE